MFCSKRLLCCIYLHADTAQKNHVSSAKNQKRAISVTYNVKLPHWRPLLDKVHMMVECSSYFYAFNGNLQN